jgi:predicted N-acetyltransferase YhbS
MEAKRQVRPIKLEEVAKHLDMLNQAYAPWGSKVEWDSKYTQPGFKPAENILVVEEDGQWVGGGTAWYRDAIVNGKRVKVYMPGDLFTHPEHGGKGIYSTSMRGLNKLAREKGATLGVTFPSPRGLPYRVLPKYGFYDIYRPRTKIKLINPARLISMLEHEKISILQRFEGSKIRLKTPSETVLFEVKESSLKHVSKIHNVDISIRSDFLTLFRIFARYQEGKWQLMLAAMRAMLSGRLWVTSSPMNILKVLFG